MESKNITGIIVLTLIVGGIFYFATNATPQKVTNPTTDVKTNTQISATTVPVARFYNGGDGYSLSIPSGNTSTCTWTWAGGSADVPYSQTTYANTATEKHTLSFPPDTLDYLYSFKVSCVDDFGNQYVGVFPNN